MTLLTTIVSLDPIHFIFDTSESDYLRYVRLRPESGSSRMRQVRSASLADETDWAHEGTMDFLDNQFNPRSGTMRGGPSSTTPDLRARLARLRLFGGEVDGLLIPDASVTGPDDEARVRGR